LLKATSSKVQRGIRLWSEAIVQKNLHNEEILCSGACLKGQLNMSKSSTQPATFTDLEQTRVNGVISPAKTSVWNRWMSLNLLQKFTLGSLIVMLSSGVLLAWWVGREIEQGVVQRTAATTALYVNSFLAPQFQDLELPNAISSAGIAHLDRLLRDTVIGRQIVLFKLWGRNGLVLYSTNKKQIAKHFPIDDSLKSAWNGQVISSISTLDSAENVDDRQIRDRLLETYSPMRQNNRVIAVAEFYAVTDDLELEIKAAKTRSWLVVGVLTLLTYVLLISLMRQASNTILGQRAKLGRQVSDLNALLEQNQVLRDRARRATVRTTTLNERFLKRVSSELHDGPAQDLSFALLKTDGIASRLANSKLPSTILDPNLADLSLIESALAKSIKEMRAIASDLRLPDLDTLSLSETVARVIRDHHRRTQSKVQVALENLPEQVVLSVKITVFRLIQEALNNAFKHGCKDSQRVVLTRMLDTLKLEVSDNGSGFTWNENLVDSGHLGLLGMRERVESLGGQFEVVSSPGRGTKVFALVPLNPSSEIHDPSSEIHDPSSEIHDPFSGNHHE
jgi:signal transduction histidine kinase